MSATTWSKFFWSDWLADPGIRRCGYAAKGLWIDMLCLAATGDPIGHVAVNGDPLTVTDIAHMIGGSETEVETLIAELERNGVFSRDRRGRIYSRRIVRDAKRTAEARKFGKQGGNPSLCKDREKTETLKGRDNPRDKAHIPSATSLEVETSSIEDVASPLKPTPRSELEKVLDPVRAKAVIDHRRAKNAPLTAHAAELLAKQLARWPDPNEAADEMIVAGWTGFKLPWMERRMIETRGHGPPSGNGTGWQRQNQVFEDLKDANQQPDDRGFAGPILEFSKPGTNRQ